MAHYQVGLNCQHIKKVSGSYGESLKQGSTIFCIPCKKDRMVIYKTIDVRR